MSKGFSYNPWPLGHLPDKWQRPEISWARERGWFQDDPREIVQKFEEEVARYAGAPYAVAVDCCSHGLFLALKYVQKLNPDLKNVGHKIPSRTYVSVPMQMLHAGLTPVLSPIDWSGSYAIGETGVFDSAGRFTSNMYLAQKGIQVLSFQIKKILPIGRGGMILVDDFEAYKWLIRARHDGRDLTTEYDSRNHILEIGWHFYMTPEDAARGLQIFFDLPKDNDDCMKSSMYPDINQWKMKIGIR